MYLLELLPMVCSKTDEFSFLVAMVHGNGSPSTGTSDKLLTHFFTASHLIFVPTKIWIGFLLRVVWYNIAVLLLCRATKLVIMVKRIEKAKDKTAAQCDEDGNLPGCVFEIDGRVVLCCFSVLFLCSSLMIRLQENHGILITVSTVVLGV